MRPTSWTSRSSPTRRERPVQPYDCQPRPGDWRYGSFATDRPHSVFPVGQERTCVVAGRGRNQTERLRQTVAAADGSARHPGDRCSPVTGRHDGRPWLPRWATSRHSRCTMRRSGSSIGCLAPSIWTSTRTRHSSAESNAAFDVLSVSVVVQ
jgi:hypothetical protein